MHVESIRNLSAEEITSTWYTKEQCAEIKRKARKIARCMAKAKSSKGCKKARAILDAGLCTRGLELLASLEVATDRKEQKDSVVGAVLNEQQRQRRANMGGALDSCAIATASRTYSEQAKGRALLLGASDDEKAKSYRLRDDGISSIKKRSIENCVCPSNKRVNTRPLSMNPSLYLGKMKCPQPGAMTTALSGFGGVPCMSVTFPTKPKTHEAFTDMQARKVSCFLPIKH